jgi:hypothetical protein
VDNHSIFRFIEQRDTVWKKHYVKTDEGDPQWKQVLQDLRIKVVYALSAQAKGKIERPYPWLQDRIVRTCARENVRSMVQIREILRYVVKRYNEVQVHSTIGEIPVIRFEKALREGKSLFRPFKLSCPYESTHDVFCLRDKRTTNACRKISPSGLEFRVLGANQHETVNLKMVPDPETGLTDIRFWHNGRLVSTQKIKTSDLSIVWF